MHPLPKTDPVREHVPASRIVVSDLLVKLAKSAFTGHLRYTAAGIEVSCIFSRGRLICATSTENRVDTSGLEALTGMLDRLLNGAGEISIYRMTPELAMCSHALLRGTVVISGAEVARMDLRGVLGQQKEKALNGVVRFTAGERQAMIFFSDGRPVGFYHDAAGTIESSPDETRRIAALPGARLDVFATRSLEELMRLDLLARLPRTYLGNPDTNRPADIAPSDGDVRGTPGAAPPDSGKLAGLLEDLHEIAMAYLSREGKLIIAKRLDEAGGPAILLDAGKTEDFLIRVAQDALKIDTPEHINEMIGLMKTEINGRLAP